MLRTISFLLCVSLAACATAPRDAPVHASKQRSPDTAAAGGPFLDARTAVRNFRTVVAAVEPVAEAVCREHAPELNCDFLIVIDDTPGMSPNAFQTLDDKGRPVIAFTIPLIAVARNQDELAFIMSHEAAHHIRGHLARLRRNAYIGAQVAGGFASLFGKGDPEAIRAAQEYGAAIGARTYSKDFELEADAMGAVITMRSGYDPMVGAAFFTRIPDPGNEFLGTHPANADRLRTVARAVATQ